MLVIGYVDDRTGNDARASAAMLRDVRGDEIGRQPDIVVDEQNQLAGCG